jgi:membrane protease YdiL (CAAX protease family)
MKSDTFEDVVTLVLSVLPIGIAFISFNVAAARWSGKTHSQAVVFLVLGLISGVYSLYQYLRHTKVRQVLEDREIFSKPRPEAARLIIKVLVGATSVLASVTLLISGGWELIQGSVKIGLILAPVGAAMLFLDRGPKSHIKVFGHEWYINVFEVTYSALTKDSTSSQLDAARASAATATH